MSIIPSEASGGVVVRDSGGVCYSPAGIANAYCPPADFSSSCEIRYLPSNCSARITPAQINAFQSEILCLAQTFNPDGNWNCGSLCNLSTTFTQWAASAGGFDGSLLDYLQTHLCSRPYRDSVEVASLPAATYIMCDGEGNIIRHRPEPVQCSGGAVIVTNLDGSETVFQSQLEEFSSIMSPGAWVVNPGQVAGGIIPNSLHTLTIELDGPCEQNVEVFFTVGATMLLGPDPADINQTITVLPEISFNGGATWQDFNEGGRVLRVVAWLGDQEYERSRVTPPLSGNATIQVRMRLIVNDLLSLSIQNTYSTLQVRRHTLRCCATTAP